MRFFDFCSWQGMVMTLLGGGLSALIGMGAGSAPVAYASADQ